MKKMKTILSCIMLFCLLLTTVSCGASSKEETYPPNYEQLSDLIGDEKEDVFAALGITEDDVEVEPELLSTYKLPKKTDYLGYSFDVYLLMDHRSEKQYGFRYMLVYENMMKKAAKCTETLRDHFSKVHGEPTMSNMEDYEDFFEPNGAGTKTAQWPLPNNRTLTYRIYKNEKTVMIELDYQITVDRNDPYYMEQMDEYYGTKIEETVYPEKYDQLSKLIGETKETVFAELGLTEEDKVENEEGNYLVPGKVEYLGFSFDVVVAINQDGEMYGFWYQRIYENDAIWSAQCVKTLLKKMKKFHGEPGEGSGTRLSEETDLVGKFEHSKYMGYDRWELSDKQYLELNVYIEKAQSGENVKYINIWLSYMGISR